MVVFIILESDQPITGKNKGDAIGVVSSQATAEAFYQKKPDYRDYIPFNLDEIPELSGTPGGPIPQPTGFDAVRQRVDQSTHRVNQNNQQMQEILQRMRRKRK